MKVIILHAGEEDQFWLHINKIKRVYEHEHIITEIYLEDNYKIKIVDYYKLFNFKKFVYAFINSEKKIEILKITDFQYCNERCSMKIKDWVRQVVDERNNNV